MTPFMWRFGGSVFAALIGVTMLNYGLERTALIRAAAAAAGQQPQRPLVVTATIFLGLVALLLGAYAAFRLWAGYILEHDGVRQLPRWFLWGLLVGSGAVGAVAVVQHWAFLADAPYIPVHPNFGYVFFVTLAGVFFALAAVALLVRGAVAAARR